MEFSLGFQIRLLVLFIINKELYLNSKDLVKPEFFNSLFLQWLYNFVDKYVDQYKSSPTKLVIEEELRNDKTYISLPEEEKLVVEFFQVLTNPDKAELEYVKDSFIKFAKARTLKSALGERESDIEQGNFDEVFSTLKQEAKKFEYAERVEDPFTFSVRHLKELFEVKQGIMSGIDLVDNTVGGLKPKEISLVLADTNVGKSLYLVHVGGSAVRQHRKVLHVTLEMSKARTLARYLANLLDEEDNLVYDNIVTFNPDDKVYNYVHDKLREKYEGNLQIVEYPTGKCSIQNLYGLLDKYPDTELLIVDYLQLLKAPKKRDQLRFELSDIAIGLRGIASECNLHTATAQQASKLAANRRLVGKEFTAEDYGIFRVIDVGIGMGQNKDDALRRQVVFWLTKSRNTEKNIAERYYIDFNLMRFRKLRLENLTGDGDGH